MSPGTLAVLLLPDGAGGGAVLVGTVGGALALGVGCQAAQSPKVIEEFNIFIYIWTDYFDMNLEQM